MATHGYIRVENEDGKDISVIHAFHDGYNSNMLRDILEIPSFIYNFLKTSERNDYKLGSFTRDKDRTVKGGFDRLRAMWSSMIPLDALNRSFSSWMTAFDPCMYAHTREDIKGDIILKFSDARLPSCIVKIDDIDEDSYDEYINYIENMNKSIYFDEHKIKVIPSPEKMLSFHMNIDLIVLDYFWQELEPSILRDKKLDKILKTN